MHLKTLAYAVITVLGSSVVQAQFGARHVLSQNPFQTAMCVGVGDIDGDGDPDILYAWSYDGLFWVPNNGGGSFGAAISITDQWYVFNIRVVDIDGDGDNDVVWSSSDSNSSVGLGVELNSDQGLTWSNTSASWHCLSPDVTLADFDGDGSLDVVAAANYDGVLWRENQGGGTFAGTVHVVDETSSRSIDAGDLDGDGDPDIISALTGAAPAIKWFANDGSGAFSEQDPVSAPYGSVMRVRLSDLDQDSDLDVVALCEDPSRLVRFMNDGSGAFGPEQIIAAPVGVSASKYELQVIDMNADNLLDLAVNAYGDGMYIVLSLAPGVYGNPILASGPPTNAFCFDDLDGDGGMDMIYSRSIQFGWSKGYWGSPFRIQGNLFIDEDGSGTQTARDIPVPWQPVLVDPFLSYSFSGPDGAYTAYADSGTFNVSIGNLGPFWTTDPIEHSVTLSTGSPVSAGNDFILTPLVDTSLLIPTIMIGNGPCGGTVPLWLSVANAGTRIEHGTLVLVMDSLHQFLSSEPSPDIISGDTLTWVIDTLSYFQLMSLYLEMERPGADHVGDTTGLSLFVFSMDGPGDTAATFQTTFSEVLACSFDPNDKRVEPPGYGIHHAVDIAQRHLDYTIRFQNTGTDTAVSVMLLDPLPSSLDPYAITLLGYSHTPSSMAFDASTGLIIRFDGIQLPDSGSDALASQGYISFRIYVRDSLPSLTAITNSAEIYFDYNLPVITNTTLTTLVDCEQFAADITWIDVDLLQASPGGFYQWFLNGDPVAGAVGQELFVTEPGSYTVSIINDYGCELISTAYEVISTSVDELAVHGMRVVPNPFADQTRLMFDHMVCPDETLDLVDLNGRTVRTLRGMNTREVVLSREGLPSGLYVAFLHSTAGPITNTRLIIE